jgi:hypothetical protein
MRTKLHAQQMIPRPTMPITGPEVWTGAELADRPTVWRAQLTGSELTDLDAAATDLIARGWPDLVDLPARHGAAASLTALTDRVRDDLLAGRGFTVLAGLPVHDAPVRVAARLWVLGSYLGAPVVQNARGHLLGHVRDLGYDAADPATRLYQTNQRQGFHTDSADLVALLCLRAAPTGGRSSLASAAAVFNALLARTPDLVGALFEPVATDHRGEQPAGARPWFEIPVLSHLDDRLTVIYQRRYIDSAQRFPGAPQLSERQRAALDAFDAALDDPAIHLEMDLAPGDLQLVHNHQLLHDRTAFVDDPDPALRRHLLRLWLCPPTGRQLPAAFTERYGSIAIGRRGGVVPRVPPVISLTP